MERSFCACLWSAVFGPADQEVEARWPPTPRALLLRSQKVLLFVHVTNAKVPRSEPKDEGSGFRITPKHCGVEYHLKC
jgi:hypothetical protein